jgi:hypothetical protein|tara:strand:+ start:2386 stop:4038 length:1653 start_codon:yes stop_codon:yes gene_type:complete
MSRIHDNRTKSYGKNTISKYKTEFVILVIKKLLLSNDFETTLYFFTELHASGKFDDIWFVIFDIMLEHIHILNYQLPFFLYNKYRKYEHLSKELKGNKLEIRNIAEMRKDLFHIVRILTFSPKENVVKYIPKSYYSVKEDAYDSLGNVFTEQFIPKLSILKEVTNSPNSKEISHAIKNFKNTLIKILKNNSLFDRMREKETIFFWLSRIIVNSFDNSNIVGYPNSVNLYQNYNRDDYDQYIMKLWNIILLSSKSNDFLFNQIGSLYQMYIICSKNKKKYDTTFLNRFIISSILYFTDKPNRQNPILQNLFNKKVDHRPIHSFYANIQEAITNDTQRMDYIELKKKTDIAKEQKKLEKKMQRESKKKSRKKSRKKNPELKPSDSRLQINETFQEKQSKIVEKQKEKLDFLINHSKYDIDNPESIPMLQNHDERERDIIMVEQQQNQINKIQKLKELKRIEQEIQEEQFNNYELETEFSEMNSSSQKQTNKLMFINDEVLPDIFRLITFRDDIIEDVREDIIENNDNVPDTHKIQTKNNIINKEFTSNVVKI